MAINWTPWFNVPMHRRLEVLSLGFFMFGGVALGPLTLITLIYLLICGSICSRVACLLYLAFVLYDRDSGERGGRNGPFVDWVRSWEFFKHCSNYFPIDLVKTVDLTPDRNYLICIFPHGLLSAGAGSNFATNYTKWSTLFPGIRPKLTTLRMNMLMPIQRELPLSCGVCSASERSLRFLLSQSNDPNDEWNRGGYTSTGVGLVLGGLRETIYTFPDTYRCVVAKRRGFVRIALSTGASLVPALSFGENNIVKPIVLKPGFLQRLMERLGKRYDDKMAFFWSGRGFFQYDYGLIPLRHPITTVIGAPIHLKKTPNPTIEEQDKVHALFCARLKELFETHKSKYVSNYEHVQLEIV